MKQVSLFSLSIFSILTASLQAQNDQSKLIKSGPMVGYSDAYEVALWLQTKEEANIQFAYWPVGEPEKNFTTDRFKTLAKDSFIITVIAKDLKPGTVYEYLLLINGFQVIHELKQQTFITQPLWEYRFDPPSFRIALGSCNYIDQEAYDKPGKPYGAGYEIFESMSRRSPQLMLWLGDNTYLRAKEWNSESASIRRYAHTRAIPELQEFLAKTHHYAIWDDHDYGPNDATFSFFQKDKTKKVFNLFWPNPGSGNSYLGGTSYSFQWNDVDFFMLDDRWFRTAQYNKGYSQILGKDQIDWLIDGLKTSRAKFKVIACGSQILNSAKVFENYANYDEREYLLRRLEEEEIKGVVFVTGDRHHAELSKVVLKNGNSLYDFTVSPLTAGVSSVAKKEKNENRVEGSLVTQRNFGEISVTGKKNDRKLKLSLFNSKGEEVWKQELKATDFGYEEIAKEDPSVKPSENAPAVQEKIPLKSEEETEPSESEEKMEEIKKD